MPRGVGCIAAGALQYGDVCLGAMFCERCCGSFAEISGVGCGNCCVDDQPTIPPVRGGERSPRAVRGGGGHQETAGGTLRRSGSVDRARALKHGAGTTVAGAATEAGLRAMAAAWLSNRRWGVCCRVLAVRNPPSEHG
eukprot:gb/GFBE01059262.1/.p2 GENE.gb/GFBE01059262.1/~~gb/GFBE01059262.1/.p2  ORF type:complete len:138 (-),score=5.42 gb/GFBE01059262.1/:21-434(-)